MRWDPGRRLGAEAGGGICSLGAAFIATFRPQISVDCLSWEFIVSTVDDSNLVYPPKVGVR